MSNYAICKININFSYFKLFAPINAYIGQAGRTIQQGQPARIFMVKFGYYPIAVSNSDVQSFRRLSVRAGLLP